MMFSELQITRSIFAVPLAQAALANKDAIARTYRKKRLVCAVSAHGRLRRRVARIL